MPVQISAYNIFLAFSTIRKTQNNRNGEDSYITHNLSQKAAEMIIS